MVGLDPKGLLPGIDWRTRKAFEQLQLSFYGKTGYGLKVRSGRRTCAEQAEQYGIGRTYNLGSKVVTNARGCQSWHVLGRAVDADPVHLATGKVIADCGLATVAGQLWEAQGGVWGGRWGGFGPCGDSGHFEWHPGLSIAQVCPNPDACETVTGRIETREPTSAVWWAVGGFALVVGLGFAYAGRKG